jgi:hypothetical protein
MKLFPLCAVVCIWLAACTGGTTSGEFKQTARGEADEIVLVIDSTIWEGPVGARLKKILRAPMPGLPQDEARFEIRKVNPMNLNSVLKSAPNMIFVTTLDSRTEQSRHMRSFFSDNTLKRVKEDTAFYQAVEKDKFANGQMVLYLFGQTEQHLVNKLIRNGLGIQNMFEERARELTRQRVFSKRQKAKEEILLKNHSYSMQIPAGYETARDVKDFVWLRMLDPVWEKSIFIHEQPYTGPEVFDNPEALRDKITELHLRDVEKQELFIARQDVVPLQTKRINFNKKFALETRGLWKVSDGSAGGPFLSYAMVDESNQMLYYIEGYVYHPAGKKKRMMREIDAILSTFRVPGEVNAPSK